MPASWRARVMAIMAPRPVGSGALMWKASAVSAAPMTSAWMGAPRSSARGGAAPPGGEARAGQAVLHRELAGGHRAREGGDGEGADLPRPPVSERLLTGDELLHAAAPGGHPDPRAVPPLRAPVAEVEARVGHRLLARGHGEVDEAAHAARHLAVLGDRRVEVLDLGGDAHVEGAGVEGGDRAAAVDAGHEVAPERGVVVADGRDRAEAGDDGAARRGRSSAA